MNNQPDLNNFIADIARGAAGETIAQLESRIQFLEKRLADMQRPKELLTEKEAAALLSLSIRTLKYMRADKQISFIEYPGRGIRYRRADIEQFLSRCERGKKAALRAATATATNAA